MLLTDVQAYDSNVLHLSISTKTKDPLGKDATNPVPNTDCSGRVCWKVPVKC